MADIIQINSTGDNLTIITSTPKIEIYDNLRYTQEILYTLNDLEDVNITGANSGDVLAYTNGIWNSLSTVEKSNNTNYFGGNVASYYTNANNLISGIIPSARLGIINNSSLANSTISGISLGSNLSTLSIGTGLTGTSYNGSTAKTITIDGTVTTNTNPQTLTNKIISGSSFTGISSFTDSNNATSSIAAPVVFSGGIGVAKDIFVGGNLNVTGNVFLTGNTTLVSGTNLIVDDSIIYLANGNPANVNDIGIVGHFNNGRYQHTGLVRDATDGIWKLFSNNAIEPTTTIDFSDANTVYDKLQVGSLISTVVGVAPIIVASNTVVANLNSELLNGNSASYYTNANNILSGTVSVSRGGTGLNAPTANSILIANGTSSYQLIAPGSNNQVLMSNGFNWYSANVSLGGGSASITVANNAPSNNSSGSMWWNTDDGSLYIYYVDGTSNQWVPAAPAGKTGVIAATAPLVYDSVNSIIGTDGTVGYKNIPQNSQGSSNYTLDLTDAGKHIYHPITDINTRTWTIPANTAVPFIIGTSIMLINDTGAGAITITITSDTLIRAGTGQVSSVNLSANGIATLIKVASTRWMINGTGLV